ncbi:OB-fold nucleic acid binding domain-containing protein [Dyadobacter sp. 676]|uniref:Error-prone DNA polymerase n=1 Tax=Dyadobacter sp. 676 TaxID=3088362 RepID=A0AAU8FWL7_9BACT
MRPGPIQGDMVHPYLRRRDEIEKEEYPSEELRKILEKTKGVPLFQEQAMNIAIVAADFTPTEADELRRSMATFKAKGVVSRLREKLVSGMMKKGYEKDFAERIFKQLEGFGSYGFPESHAASFALLVYVSSWIKYHHPDVFAAALLNSQPMGFYRPAQIVIDARNHGVEVRPVDINYSFWDNTLENIPDQRCALRLGFRQVKGLKEEEMHILVSSRTRPFTHIHQLLEIGISNTTLEKLADADAFCSIGFDRRQAFWEISALTDRPAGLFAGHAPASNSEPDVRLPAMTLSEHVIHDYSATSLSLKAHPVSFVRDQLNALGATRSIDLQHLNDGQIVKVAGLVLVRQRPGTASGICFITVEDETGTANLVVFKNIFDAYRKEILRSKLLMIEGKVQKEGQVIHVVAGKCFNVSGLLRKLAAIEEQGADVLTLSEVDEKGQPDSRGKSRKILPLKNPQAEIFPASRDFK